MQERVVAGSLVLEHISKTFQQAGRANTQAVDDISLNIREGEFLTLLGPSGCGKTTTLRMIAGFEFPTHGRILLDGKDIQNVPPNQRPMAMVFQSYALFPHLNVFENVAYGLRMKKMRPAEIQDAVEVVLHMVNLADLAKRSPHELSGGQQQRVALARAMVMKPKVLLFDEPLSNLDAKLRAQMRGEIRKLQQRLGITSVYVTHDQTEAMSLSDRIVIMNRGHIEQVGTPEEVYHRPDSVFVADFIGRANFVEAPVVDRQDGHATVLLFGQPIALPCSPAVAADGWAYAVIRPESVRLAQDLGSTMGEIKAAVYLGSSAEYEVEIGDQILVAVDSYPQPGCLFSEGSQVGVTFDTSRSYLLPCQ